MFLKEALVRCSELQQAAASHYDALCSERPADVRMAEWRGAAMRGRRRAEFLGALARLCTALDDEGPFLVQIPLQIAEARRVLDSIEWRRDACTSHPECACAQLLERIDVGALYADLIELAEPEVRRALRVMANEVRTARRADTAGVRRSVKTIVASVA